MSDVYQCSRCKPACFLVADDDDIPISCPYCKDMVAEDWRQIQ